MSGIVFWRHVWRQKASELGTCNQLPNFGIWAFKRHTPTRLYTSEEGANWHSRIRMLFDARKGVKNRRSSGHRFTWSLCYFRLYPKPILLKLYLHLYAECASNNIYIYIYIISVRQKGIHSEYSTALCKMNPEYSKGDTILDVFHIRILIRTFNHQRSLALLMLVSIILHHRKCVE